MLKKVKWLGMAGMCLLLTAGLSSCSEKEREGCTDPLAENFDNSATSDNGTCTYSDTMINIWSMGEPGQWGDDPAVGAIEILECQGSADTIALNTDTAGNSDMALAIVRESVNSSFFISARVINTQNGLPWANGYLIFDAMLPANSTLTSFDLSIHGTQCFEPVNCASTVCISTPLEISTTALNDSAFTQITIPMTDFERRHLQNTDILFAIKDSHTGGSDTVLYVKDLFWRTVL